MSHDWKRLKLTNPSLCFSCHKAIWAPFSAAVRCGTCSLKAHKACASKTTVRCTKMAPQSFMAVGVVSVRVISGVNMDLEADTMCQLQLDQQTATTRISFGGAALWNQTFTFIVSSSSKRKLVLECFEQEYMENTFLGSCVIPNLHEYSQEEELFADLQRGGVKTKLTLQLSIHYKPLYSHDVEWHFDPTSTTATPNLPNRRLKRRHSSGPATTPSKLQTMVQALQSAEAEAPTSPVLIHTKPTNFITSQSMSSIPTLDFAASTDSPSLISHITHDDYAPNSDPTSEELKYTATPSIAPSESPQLAQDQAQSQGNTNDESNDDYEEEDLDGEYIIFRDHFGFPIESSHIEAYLAMFEFQFSTRMKEQADYLAKHLNKMLSTNISRPIVSREFVGFAKSGFPLSHRGDLWQVLSGSKDALRRHPGLYEKLLKRNQGVETAATSQIEKDLHRTFIGNPLLRTKEDVKKLQRVLNAFSFYDPQTGYCQSLNFIAALYLLLMSEEEAFWLLIVTTKRFLPEYYTPDMVGSKTDAHIFEAMLYTYFPLIAHQLFDLGLPVVLRTASWFLCMFVTILPVETTMRVFDWMFVEGSQVIFSVGLALFHLSQNELSSSDSFDSAYFTFTTMTQHCYNADHLIELAATKYQLIRKEIAMLRTKLRLEYSRRDEQELISSLNLSPEDFYELVSQLEEVSSASKTQAGSSKLRTTSASSGASTTDSQKVRNKTISPATIPETKEQVKAELESVVLDKARFVAVFKKIFPDLDPSVPESVFDTLDSDEDASLTIKECLLGISAFVVGAPEKKAMMWFRVFDKNNDGILDVAEIRSLLSLVWKLIDKQLDHRWIDTFLQVVESTHAGRITKSEFVNACLDMPVLSEWLKFGFTLGDRMKIIAAKEEAAQHVAHSESLKKSSFRHSDSPARSSIGSRAPHNRSHSKDIIHAPLPVFRPDPNESEDENLNRFSSSPPHTWIDEDGRVNPLLVTGTISPTLVSDDDTDRPRHRADFDSDTDLEDSSFYLV